MDLTKAQVRLGCSNECSIQLFSNLSLVSDMGSRDWPDGQSCCLVVNLSSVLCVIVL